jgi:hypothetical protein
VRVGAALAVLGAAVSGAAAEPGGSGGSGGGSSEPRAAEGALYDRLWPRPPEGSYLTLSQQITDQLTLFGNTLGSHLDALSMELVSLRFDGRRRRAFVRLGGGDAQYLTFRLASDVHFTEGLARVTTRIDLGLAGRRFHLELPEVEMTPTEYRGERGVVVRLPLFRRDF